MNQSLSDVALIYIVLVVLYGIESIAWIRPGSTALVTWFGRLRNPAANVRLARNDSGHVVLFGLAPFDATFVAEPCPLSLSPLGVLGFSSATPISGDRPANTEMLCTWDEAKRLHCVERELWVGERLVSRLGAAHTAQKLCTELRSIATLSADERSRAIETFAHNQFDATGVRSRIAQWTQATRNIKAWSTLLAIWIFVVGLLRYHGLVPGFTGPDTLWIYLAALFLIWWTTVACVVRGHRKLYPEDRTGRWKLGFTAILSPAVCLRAADHLARRLLELKHPLAVVAAIGRPSELKELACFVIRDLRHPKPPDSPTDAGSARQIVAQYRESQISMVIRLCQREAIDVSEACSAPVEHDAGSMSYCPRCLQEFSLALAECTACGNLPTVAFNSDRTSTPVGI